MRRFPPGRIRDASRRELKSQRYDGSREQNDARFEAQSSQQNCFTTKSISKCCVFSTKARYCLVLWKATHASREVERHILGDQTRELNGKTRSESLRRVKSEPPGPYLRHTFPFDGSVRSCMGVAVGCTGKSQSGCRQSMVFGIWGHMLVMRKCRGKRGIVRMRLIKVIHRLECAALKRL